MLSVARKSQLWGVAGSWSQTTKDGSPLGCGSRLFHVKGKVENKNFPASAMATLSPPVTVQVPQSGKDGGSSRPPGYGGDGGRGDLSPGFGSPDYGSRLRRARLDWPWPALPS